MNKRSAPCPRKACGAVARPARRWAVASALAALALPAWADDDPNPYTLGILETVSHDSNIFRAPNGNGVSADWLSTTGLVASLDQPIGRERLKFNGEVDLNRFKRNLQLNSSSHSLGVEGDWATVDHLSGELGYSDSSQLYRYNLSATELVTAKNTLDTRRGFARFHLGTVTKLTFDAIFNSMQQDFSAPVYRYRELRRWDGSVGVAYQSSADLRTTLSYRRTHGEYPHFTQVLADDGSVLVQADNFSRNDAVLGIVYDASGASRFRLNISTGREDHSVITSRSFHSWATDGQWVWTPAGRTQLTVDFIRDDDAGTVETPFAAGTLLSATDARVRTAVSSKLTYELTGKIMLNAGMTLTKRKLDSAFSGLIQSDANGSDKLLQTSLGLDYAPIRAIRLGCNAAWERRTVDGASALVVTYPYKDTLLSCTGQFSFN